MPGKTSKKAGQKPQPETPDLKQIGERLIELGKQALELAGQAAKTEQAQTVKREAKVALGDLKSGLKKAGTDFKSGKLQAEFKKDAKNALDFLSDKLDKIDAPDEPKK